MTGFTDWQDLGIFPCQDHDPERKRSLRQQLVGGRISRLADPDSGITPADSLLEYAREDGMGTLGDIHPWAYWQTAGREKREMGSWSLAWAALTTGGATGGYGRRTGQPVTASTIHPLADEKATYDPRYKERAPGWPRNFPATPRGVECLLMPATEDTEQKDVLLRADPRLFCPSVSGPAECATTVVDLQPSSEPCMSGSSVPGIGGRHARLTSSMRVVAMREGRGIRGLESSAGNGIAWNLSVGRIDGIAGYGMCWGKVSAIGATQTRPTGPTTPSGGQGGAYPQRTASVAQGGQNGRSNGTPDVPASAEGRAPEDYGQFSPRQQRSHGVGLAAHDDAFGPLTVGHLDDKHKIDTDRDGHPINSLHIHTDAYFFRGREEDAPLFFEGEYPDPPAMPFEVQVHLGYDQQEGHPFVGGNRRGMWKWWAEVPYMGPVTGSPARPSTPRPPGPVTPGGPTTPSTPGPTEPRPPGPNEPGGPTTPGTPRPTGNTFDQRFRTPKPVDPRGLLQSQTIERVGDPGPGDRALYSIHHPMMESWASWSWRPQLWHEGAVSRVHNPEGDRWEAWEAESRTPQVLAMSAWGAQNGGDWDYTEEPLESRARGGTAHGGILLHPPQFVMEDYLGIQSQRDVETITSRHYLMLAPGVELAFGQPEPTTLTATGVPTDPRTIIIGPDPDDPTDGALLLSQIASDGTRVTLLTGKVSQSSDEVVVEIGTGANQAVQIARGTTAQRPSTISPAGGMLRVNSSGAFDVLEYYDAQNTQWRTVDSSV